MLLITAPELDRQLRYWMRKGLSQMNVYFSHSYRDVGVNGYFIERLANEDISLRADQKTDVWCVAKLERYLAETTGFISVITRRPTDKDPSGYSPYIGREFNLARRARVPRLFSWTRRC